MQFFVINMEEATERKKLFFDNTKRFSSLCDRIQIFKAISKNDKIQLNTFKKKYNIEISNDGEAGCALSHILIWESFLKSNDEHCVVFEDDAKIIHDKFLNVNELLKEIDKSDFDLMYLGSRINHNTNFEPIGGWGTEGYIVSKSGAKKLFDILTLTPSYHPIDNQLQSHIKTMANHCKKKQFDFIKAYRAKTVCVKHCPNGKSCIGRPPGHWLLNNEK